MDSLVSLFSAKRPNSTKPTRTNEFKSCNKSVSVSARFSNSEYCEKDEVVNKFILLRQSFLKAHLLQI